MLRCQSFSLHIGWAMRKSVHPGRFTSVVTDFLLLYSILCQVASGFKDKGDSRSTWVPSVWLISKAFTESGSIGKTILPDPYSIKCRLALYSLKHRIRSDYNIDVTKSSIFCKEGKTSFERADHFERFFLLYIYFVYDSWNSDGSNHAMRGNSCLEWLYSDLQDSLRLFHFLMTVQICIRPSRKKNPRP